MKFKLEIDCDNAEFADDELMFVIASKLSGVAAEVMAFELGIDNPLLIHDINGNQVGRAWIEP